MQKIFAVWRLWRSINGCVIVTHTLNDVCLSPNSVCRPHTVLKTYPTSLMLSSLSVCHCHTAFPKDSLECWDSFTFPAARVAIQMSKEPPVLPVFMLRGMETFHQESFLTLTFLFLGRHLLRGRQINLLPIWINICNKRSFCTFEYRDAIESN